MKYSELIHFEPIESIVQLRETSQKDYAFSLLDTYVISERMAEVIDEIIIEQLQYSRPADNKGLLVVGNYGTGKSHLMSVIATIAEIDGSGARISNERVSKKAKEIEGKFKVIRSEIGSTTMTLRDYICGEIQDALAEMGVDFEFPPMDQVRNNKDSFVEMMGRFHEVYPDQGLLLVVDELLDYLRTRNGQEVILDLGFLRELGEICRFSKFRFIAGVQEMLFDNPKFQFVAEQLRRVKERYWAEQVLSRLKEIADIKQDEFIVLAGEVYYKCLAPYLNKVWLPLKGKALGEWIPELNNLIELESKKDLCLALHMFFNALPRMDWTMIKNVQYKNGIYIMFEKGQSYLGMDRIVRVGTHRGQDRLKIRLEDHFVKSDSDRSIFRKNIGRALLSKANDTYIKAWELDTTKAEDKVRNGHLIDEAKEAEIEKEISSYLKNNISFLCFPVETETERLRLEEGIISLLNKTHNFKPCDNWLGLSSPIKEISNSGLWNKQGLNGEPLNISEFSKIKHLIRFGSTNNEYTAQCKDKYVNQTTPGLSKSNVSGSKTADDIRKYIDQLFQESRQQGKEYIELVSGSIHNYLGMENRMPQVCRIMYEKMKQGDELLHTTPSGKSSTIKIRYYLR